MQISDIQGRRHLSLCTESSYEDDHMPCMTLEKAKSYYEGGGKERGNQLVRHC